MAERLRNSWSGPTIMHVLAFIIGLFYAGGGFLIMRHLAMDTVIDDFLTQLGDKGAGRERSLTRLNTLAAVLLAASGVSLMAMSRWTPLLFLLGALVHALQLYWNWRLAAPGDAVARAGVRSNVRALAIYNCAFGFALYLDGLGLWRVWLEPAFLEPVMIVGGCAAVALFMIRAGTGQGTGRSVGAPAYEPPVEDEELAARPPRNGPPENLRLAPEYRCWPLWDADTGDALAPEEIGLAPALTARIRAWDEPFQAIFDPGDPFSATFPDLETERAWVHEGNAVAAELVRQWPGRVDVRISGLTSMLGYASRDLAPGERIPDDRLPDVGRYCRIAEIEEVIARLDKLAAEKRALPDWDGDSQDDVAHTQRMLARILATVPERYEPVVRQGLASEEEETRRWVALALDGSLHAD